MLLPELDLILGVGGQVGESVSMQLDVIVLLRKNYNLAFTDKVSSHWSLPLLFPSFLSSHLLSDGSVTRLVDQFHPTIVYSNSVKQDEKIIDPCQESFL